MSSASELPVVPGHFRQGYIAYTAFVVPSCEESKDLKRDYAKHEDLMGSGMFPPLLDHDKVTGKTSISNPATPKLQDLKIQSAEKYKGRALRLAKQVQPELKTQSAAKFKVRGLKLANQATRLKAIKPPRPHWDTVASRYQDSTHHSLGQDHPSEYRGCGDTFQKVGDIINIMDTPAQCSGSVR
ncbi:hypothetical protein B0H14DRAFT_2556689 [Mycena olivaceomarginata]|nr:hypothetical protein B0H14DRAFT_2556689 [Mycena olivaceomarginata]